MVNSNRLLMIFVALCQSRRSCPITDGRICSCELPEALGMDMELFISAGMNEIQFLIVSTHNKEVLVRRKSGYLTLPGTFAYQDRNSLVELAYAALGDSSPVFPVAIIWSECRDCTLNSVHTELEKKSRVDELDRADIEPLRL